MRDFVPSALVFLMRGEAAIVRNFLTTVMPLRGQQQVLEGHSRSRGLMPASFKVVSGAGGERYDGKRGGLVGRRANYFQVWSATGLIVARELLENPESRTLFDSYTRLDLDALYCPVVLE